MKEIQLQKISSQIEKLRCLMNNIALIYGISHPLVLRVSKSLDKRINQYIRIKEQITN